MVTFPINCCGEVHCVDLFDDFEVYLRNHFPGEVESIMAFHELGADLCPCVSFLEKAHIYQKTMEELASMESFVSYHFLSSDGLDRRIKLRCFLDSVEYIIKNSKKVMDFYYGKTDGASDRVLKKYQTVIINALRYIEAVRKSGYKNLPKRPVCHGIAIHSAQYLSSGFLKFKELLRYNLHEYACMIMDGEDSKFLAWMEKGTFVSYGDLVLSRDDIRNGGYEYHKAAFRTWMSMMISQILEDAAREAGCDI